MKKTKRIRKLFILSMLPFCIGCQEGKLTENSNEETISEETTTTRNEPISPLVKISTDKNKVALGKKLFHDKRLSGNNSFSCATCHNLNTGGVDNKKFSSGMQGEGIEVNTPTVYNAVYNFRQFWNGRVKTLEEQVDGPVLSSMEMGSKSWEEILLKLRHHNSYEEEFENAFDDGFTAENIRIAISEFEKTLVTPSRFDDYLLGDDNAITEKEKKGYLLFKDYGCVSCHQGMNVGGNMYQKIGIADDYFKNRGGEITKADLGRYNVTKKESDKGVFKVPSLRNIALTKPYFHDGTQKTLEQVVQTMSHYQLGRQVSKEEGDLIVAFLKTLTGKELEKK